ncbi:MAG: ABC transporter ATP-binding protein [Lachnospiraceae bacterium]
MSDNGRAEASAKRMLLRIAGYLFKYYKLPFTAVLILIVLHALSGVAAVLLLRLLIDNCLAAPGAAVRPAALIIGGMAVVYYAGVLCHYLYNYMMIEITRGTTRNIRVALFSHMEKLPLQYFDTRSHGDLMSVFTNDTDTLRQLISQCIPQLLSGAVVIASAVSAMSLLNFPLLCISLAAMISMLVAGHYLTNKSSRHFMQQQKDFGALNGYIEEMIEGQKEIKLFKREAETMISFQQLNQELAASARKANMWGNLLTPIVTNLSYLAYSGTAIAGIVLICNPNSGFTVGMLAAFLQLCRMLSQPVSQISGQISYIVTAAAGARRMFALLDEETEADQGTVTLTAVSQEADGTLTETKNHTGIWAWRRSDGQLVRCMGAVTFKQVGFGYQDGAQVLHEMNLNARPGTKIAIVGPTGAGKTTIANLLNRFYEVTEGSILIDGIDIREIKKVSLRRAVGVVLQDPRLFVGTVKENILFGRPGATDCEMIAAAKISNAHKFISELKDGYETELTTDGRNLSEGERQLITLARAVIADTPLLVMDEATASVDTRMESLIQNGLDNLMYNRTVFIIAHRLSTVRLADEILVIENGCVAESGAHEQLIRQDGLYARLFK